MALELYDIMAEDLVIYAKQKKKQVEVLVTNDDDEVVYHELSHQAAWDSLVYFAKQILAENERMEKEDV